MRTNMLDYNILVTYDQLNLGEAVGVEVLARRVRAGCQAHSQASNGKLNFFLGTEEKVTMAWPRMMVAKESETDRGAGREGERGRRQTAMPATSSRGIHQRRPCGRHVPRKVGAGVARSRRSLTTIRVFAKRIARCAV